MANPLDYLKDKNNTWQDIATAWFSKGRQNKRKALLATAFLGWMGGRENRMISDTNRRLRALEREGITEQARALKLWEEHAKVTEDHKKYLDDDNYFYTQAEEMFDSKNKNWFESPFSLQGTSQAAHETREKEIKEQAEFLRNQHFLKMNYKPTIDPTKGVDPKFTRFEFDNITKLPKDQDPNSQIRNVYQTKEQFIKPIEDYIYAKQENILDPKNISWAHSLIGKITGDTKVQDPDNLEGPKVTLVELQTRSKNAMQALFEAETRTLTTPIVTNDELRKMATIPRFRNIYKTEMVQDPNDPNKKVVKTVFTFGSDEAQQRARYLTQNLEEGIAKAVAMQIKTSEKSSFSMRDIEGYILSQTITNNTITNEIKKRSDAYKNTFISDNVRYLKDVDIDIWAATTKDNDEEELVRLSYLSGRTQIVDSALGTTNEIKNNIAKVRRIKHILSSEGFTNSEKVIAKKELIDMGTSTIDATLAAALARDVNDEMQQLRRTAQYQMQHKIGDNAIETGMKLPSLEDPSQFVYLKSDPEWIVYQHNISKALIDNLTGLLD